MKEYIIKKIVSIPLILTLIIGTYTLPSFAENDQVFADSKFIKVKFRPNGGKFVKQKIKLNKKKYVMRYIKSKKVFRKSKYGKLPKVKRNGYKFKGWYTKKEKGKKKTSKSKVKNRRNHCLYAKWNPRKYKIYFDSNGGTSISYKKIKYSKVYGKLPVSVKKDHIFLGWFSKDGKKIKETDKYNISKNSTIYARWTKTNSTILSQIGKSITELNASHIPVRTVGDYSYYYDNVSEVEYYFKKGKCIILISDCDVFLPDIGNMSKNELDKKLAVTGKMVMKYPSIYSYYVNNKYIFVELENDRYRSDSRSVISTVDFTTYYNIAALFFY